MGPLEAGCGSPFILAMIGQQKSESKHPLRRTLIAAFVLGALFSMKMMATGLVFVVMFLVFWLPYSLIVLIRSPEKRTVQARKIGIWLLMISTVLAIHLVRHVYARTYAESVVVKIEQFHKLHGRYPNDADEIGVNRAEIRERLGLSHYSSQPIFYYANTAVAFHLWSYDFEKREWIDEGD
jgi:low temperature requirement protein LtrA